MKFMFLILLSFSLSGQTIVERWNAIPSEKRSNIDHTFDFYSRMAATWTIAEIVYKKTDRMGLAALSGLAVGVGSVFLERGPYGKAVSLGGALTGAMAFRVRIDIRDRNRQELIEKRRKVEQIKLDFNDL